VQAIPAFLSAACGAIPLEGSLITGLFLAGAASSALHCGPMCGGFVLGQVADRIAAIPVLQMCEWRRLGASALLPYHLGRVTTYAALGALAGLAGAFAEQLPQVTGALLLLAAWLFLAMAWRRWKTRWGRTVGGRLPPTRVTRLSAGSVAEGTGGAGTRARLAAGLAALRQKLATAGWRPPRNLRGFPLGLLLGFLPCGVVYAALAAVAAGHDPLIGAVGMAAFGAGTTPVLIAIGLAGHAAGQRWQGVITAAAPFILVLNATLLALLALRGLLV
jgi:sulfite exporter TauE/SafE